MRRALAAVAIMVAVAGAGAVRADSTPFVGIEHGIELCPESICGVAIFAGVFQGRLGNNPNAVGVITVAVKHDPLPPPGQQAAITSGTWQLVTAFKTIGGHVTGELLAENTVQFDVTATLFIDHGGSGQATFTGLLDHTFFPPHIDGFITP